MEEISWKVNEMKRTKLTAVMIFSLLLVSSIAIITPIVMTQAGPVNVRKLPTYMKPTPVDTRATLITNPTNGETVSDVVTITTSSAATITIDGVRVARKVTSFDWDTNNYEDGEHTINARYRRTSETITVTVDNGGTPPPPPPEDGKYAVVIGIADYDGTQNDLWNPDADASEFRQILIGNGYATENIVYLIDEEATAQAIFDAIAWLVDIEGPDDEVVFFYSGHGYQASDADGWDTDSESDGMDEGIVSWDTYGLPDGDLKTAFAGLECSKIAMVFCSCHSGGMFDDNDDLQGANRIIASACKADQYGWDYLNLVNTLHFYYFGDLGLLRNNADSIESAHAYAYPFVVAEQPDSQPQLYDNYPGEFYL